MCIALEADCSKLVAPVTVVTANMPFGMMGLYYPGERYIFIHRYLPPRFRQEVEFHETVHYVAWEIGKEREKCASEELARKLTALEFNYVYTDEWKQRYGCGTP